MGDGPAALAFVGSYSEPDQPGVHVVAMDGTGRVAVRRSFAGVHNPSFLTVHPSGRHVYAVGETSSSDGGDGGSVHALRIDHTGQTIDLTSIGHRPSEGDLPCHLRIDHTGRWLAVVNYGTGNLAVLPIHRNGALGSAVSTAQHAGSGPRADRQSGPHTHSSIFTPDNRFLIVADLGIDRLVVYAFDDLTGSLATHREIAMAPGSGPRHLAFHPSGRHLFVSNELDSTLTVLEWHDESGTVNAGSSCSTVPAGVTENSVADLHIDHDGSHVYVSNRGHDSISVLAFDPDRGLERIAARSSGGSWPRGFALAPGGRHVVVANRYSDEIAVLPVIRGGSDLGNPVAKAHVAQPTCVVFAVLEPPS